MNSTNYGVFGLKSHHKVTKNQSVGNKLVLKCIFGFGFQLHPRLVHTHSLQANTQRLRVGSSEHRQGQQPQRLPALPL